jgi:hypothetical protein
VPRGEVEVAPEDDGPGPAREPGQEPGKELGEVVPAGDHEKGGWTTVSVGNREEGSGLGVVVGGWRRGRRTHRIPHGEK